MGRPGSSSERNPKTATFVIATLALLIVTPRLADQVPDHSPYPFSGGGLGLGSQQHSSA